MDNHNTFNPPVDAGAGAPPAGPVEPVEPTEPVTPEEPEEKLDDVAPAEFGATSDYNGYGTDEKGYDIEKNDLGPDYYNAQAHRGAEALYAAAEAEEIAKEEADEAAWNAEDKKKERNDKIRLAVASLRDTIKEANDRLDAIDAIIKEGQKRAESMGIKEINNEDTTPTVNAVDTPSININGAEDMTVGATTMSATEARTDFSTANPQPITNEEAKDINKSPATAPSTDAKIPPQDDLRYMGKDGLVYSDRQQAVDSFRD